VTHFSRVNMIVIDVPDSDHDQELAFWATATGSELAHIGKFPEYHGGRLGAGAGDICIREANGWWIMRDPAGLVFCVVPDPPGALTEDNAQCWD
jgi:hypothetical protein